MDLQKIIDYIIKNPIYCLLLLGVCYLSIKLEPHDKSSMKAKKNALIEDTFNKTFKGK